MSDGHPNSPGGEQGADGRPLPGDLYDEVNLVIRAAAEAAVIDLTAFWQCFLGGRAAFSRWRNEGKEDFSSRLIAMFSGSKSGSGYRSKDASVTWDTLSPHLKRGDYLVPKLKAYRESLVGHEGRKRLERLNARVTQARAVGQNRQRTGEHGSQPAYNLAKIKDEERLFSVLPLLGQSDERGADLILDMSFGAPNREIIDENGVCSTSDTINVAINRCGIHVDWPSGEVHGDSQVWLNTAAVEHKLNFFGVRRARVWHMESCVPGAPIQGVFDGQYLCRLKGPDRLDVRVRLSFSVSDLKITSTYDGALIGNDRLRVFKRYLATAVEHEFDQDSLLTVFNGSVQKLGDA